MEIWKAIVGYEGHYEVSDCGNVRSLNWNNEKKTKNLWLKPTNAGYKQVYLFKDGKGKMFLVHRLVAQAFIPNPNDYPQINHKDENKSNNCVRNLEWCTCKDNVQKYVGNHPNKKGSPKKPTTENRYIRNLYKINQLTASGETIRVWDYAIDIKHALGYHTTSIWECCEGKRKTAYGYKWQFDASNINE